VIRLRSRLIRRLLPVVTLAFIVVAAIPSQAAITPSSISDDLAAAMTHGVVSGSDLQQPSDSQANGVSDSALAGFPTDGATFTILTSGDVKLADEPNNFGDSGAALTGSDLRGAYDVSILTVDLNVPSNQNCLTFQFRFLSEEYPEWVGQGFNDGFIAELDTSDWTVTGSTISAPHNFAFDSGHNVVSINSTGVAGMSAGEAAGTTYDGGTQILTAQTPVTTGDHSVYFTIFDAGDHDYDSAAFLDGLSLGASGEGGCQAGVVVNRSLNVQAVGDGSGSVSDGDGGQIDCSGSESDCSGSYPDGTEVTLTATPNEGSVFAGWGDDDCATATGDTCTLTMDGDKNVTAIFDPVNAPGTPILNQALAGNHEVGLKWSAPDSDGPITKYTVYADPCPPANGEGPCIVLDNVSPNPNSGSTFNYVIGGLTNGVTYTFTVTASNGEAEGPPSNELSATPTASADTDTIGANGRGTVDTGFAGGANSSDPSCATDPSSPNCKNIVARYSLVDRKNVGAVIGLASVPNEQTPGGPIACLEFMFAINKVAASPDCEPVAGKSLLSIYPTNVTTLARPHFAFEQDDATVTTMALGAPCLQLVTNANGTPKVATNGEPICKNPNFPSAFGTGPIKTNICPDGIGWTPTKPCAHVYYKVERIDGYDLSPADCAGTWPNCTWGTLANPKARRPVQCSSGPTCGKEVIIGSSVAAGIKLASGQFAVRPWCQGPQPGDDVVAPFIKWLPCDLLVVWLNGVKSTSVHFRDVVWTDLEVNDPGGARH
jgi:hypothetical protein